MDGALGKQFLSDYIAQTNESYALLLNREIEKARKVGEIPAQILEAFSKTALRGKRIRGALMQLGYEAAGGTDIASVQHASLSVELLHAGLLVHDDIMDRDDVRRGLPSMHVQFAKVGKSLSVVDPKHFGLSQAINIADAAYYLSLEVLVNSDFSPETLVSALRVYAEHVVRTAYGQELDVANIASQRLTEHEILSVVKYKTAEYTGVMPFLMGAALAGLEDERRLDIMREYAYNFGWAFQIQDDVLGLYGDEELGKPIGSDIQEGKNTLLMLKLYELGSDDDREFMAQTLGKQDLSVAEVGEMRKRVKDSGAYQVVYDMAAGYVGKGREQVIHITHEKRVQNILESLIIYMLERAV
ncbi:polyprenyl synthetase family protein [candidate division WWE3 bacterium]|uniref:Polyprenyl synthetase family protein n=1 Tax=candidate division WWE3 bacterium TaxID=2053526 RepID=A0A955LJI8_UNCKA|nr:polyprenyl synthetase family protein [candidate division WWE3 bacterium]